MPDPQRRAVDNSASLMFLVFTKDDTMWFCERRAETYLRFLFVCSQQQQSTVNILHYGECRE